MIHSLSPSGPCHAETLKSRCNVRTLNPRDWGLGVGFAAVRFCNVCSFSLDSVDDARAPRRRSGSSFLQFTTVV